MVRLPENRGDEYAAQNGLPSLADLSHEVRELVRLISTTDISELHLESGPVRITIKRGGQLAVPQLKSVYTPPAVLPQSESAGIANLIGSDHSHDDEVPLAEGEQFIVAPMVGTFYSAPAPDAAPYVSEGDAVEPGQTVGLIEAMKMMNEIDSDFAGRITRVLVQNAQPVEYGQRLMVIQVDS